MVTNHYRWDFIGLSTDEKPTPATSEKVTNGSTFYCSDNSKLYVWYKNQWYERKALGGGGGGGTTYTAGEGIDITDDTISVDTTTIQPKLTAGSNVTISGSTISATDTTYSTFTGTTGVDAGTSGLVPAPATTDAGKFLKADGTWDIAGGGSGLPVRALTTADYNYPINNPTSVHPGLLEPGFYFVNDDNVVVYNGGNSLSYRSGSQFIVSPVSGNTLNEHNMEVIDCTSVASDGTYKISFYKVDLSNGSTVKRTGNGLLDGTYVADNLTTNNSARVLSANQGTVIRNYLIKTPYCINITDLPTVGNTATNVNVYTDFNLENSTTAQLWFNSLRNDILRETQKLALVDKSTTPANIIFLNPITTYKPNPNLSSPSTTTKCEMDFAYFDGTAMRTLRMWVDGTADFQFAVV